jgi:hypothetical protein
VAVTDLDEPGELPADMTAAIDALPMLGDEDLWRAARQSLASEKAAAIEELHLERQRVAPTRWDAPIFCLYGATRAVVVAVVHQPRSTRSRSHFGNDGKRYDMHANAL